MGAISGDTLTPLCALSVVSGQRSSGLVPGCRLQTAHNASLYSPASPATLHLHTGLGGNGRFVYALLVLSIIALEVFRHFL